MKKKEWEERKWVDSSNIVLQFCLKMKKRNNDLQVLQKDKLTKYSVKINRRVRNADVVKLYGN